VGFIHPTVAMITQKDIPMHSIPCHSWLKWSKILMDPITGAATIAATAGTTKAIEKSAAALIEKLPLKFAKDQLDILKFKLNKGLPDYLLANYAKCETLKTLLNRNDPVALEDCFVAPNFSTQRSEMSSDDLLNTINRKSGKFIITGLAGSGKSVFLKWSFRKVIERGHSYYPVFFELRNLNKYAEKHGLLLNELYSSINQCCDSFTRAQFNHGLRNGSFYFLLDGLDELNQEIRDQVSSEISDLARNYNKCVVLVTSRPSDEFVSWEGFSEAKLLPFDLAKAVDYISKLTFNVEKKANFLSDLKDGLFEKNKDFLSNPLLCAMMLLTYDSFGEIPEKKHIFYSKCFEVLTCEHDASKGRYKRQLFSKFSVEEIERAFMFFCAFSYSERIISFNSEQMAKYVNEAIAACGIDADTESVIKDFRESISIMERVGLSYEFAHRSFQEYFYAKFVITDRRLSLEEKIGWLTQKFSSDDAVEMIADMDRTYFEDEYLIPNIIKLDNKMKKVNSKQNPSAVFSKFFTVVHAENYRDAGEYEDGRQIYYTLSNSSNHYLYRQATIKYAEHLSPDLINSLHTRPSDYQSLVAILDKEYGGEIKIHHANNKKLVHIRSDHRATEMKQAITELRAHLEQKQMKRKRGLGALIRRHYEA
jgi:hypothetical protein